MSEAEPALERFDAAWASGVAPEISEFLPVSDSGVARRALLVELVMIDLERRWRASTAEADTLPSHVKTLPDKPVLEDYVNRYPELGPHDSLPAELIGEEYRIRSMWGDKPVPGEYKSRFPERFSDLLGCFQRVDVELETSQQELPQLEATLAGRSVNTSIGAVAGTVANTLVSRQFGDYEIIEELARGGMGVVFKARQQKADRLVALKMILAGQLADHQEVQRFYGEAQAAAKLEHPNIVPIYDVGEFDGQHYFSMRFVKGQPLKNLVADGPLPSNHAARLLQLISQAVAYAHQQGIIHRDLKPANVLVDPDGNPHVTDFGLAKQLGSQSELTATGQVMGTPSYMPPEQASGKIDEVGPVADVYSLGAVLYELLTGRPPFQAAAVFDVLTAVMNQEPVAPRTLNPVIDRDLETICLKCLEKDPQRRYHSATELAEELNRFLNQEPIRARPVSAWERSWRWCQRHRAISALSVGLVVSLVIGMAATMYFAIQMQRQAVSERTARKAAQREQYAAILNKVQLENATRTEVGWTWSIQSDLLKAAVIDVPKDQAKLRTFATETLLSLDVRPVGAIATDVAIVDVCFCDASNQLFVAEEKRGMELRILLYDVETGALVRKITHATVSENFERLTGRVFDFLQGGSKKQVGKFQEGLRVLACSPDGKWLAAGTRFGKLILWDLSAPKTLPQVIDAHGSELLRIEFSPNSQRLYASNKTNDQAAAGIRIWQLESDHWELEKSLPDVGGEFCVSPDGTQLAVKNEKFRLWDTSTWAILASQKRAAGSVPTFTNDGRFLVSQEDEYLLLRNVLTGEEVTRYRDPDFHDGYDGDVIQCLGDGYHVVVSSYAHEGVRIYDLMRGQRIVNLPSWGKKGTSFCISNDGKKLAVVESQQVRLYETRRPLQFHVAPMREPQVERLSFSQDGRRLAVLRSGTSESTLRQVVTDILRVETTGGLRLEKRHRVRQEQPSFTRTPHNRPGFIALSHDGGTVAVSEPLLGVRSRNKQGVLFLPAEIPGRVPRQFHLPLEPLHSEEEQEGKTFEAHITSEQVDGESYGVWVDMPTLKVGWESPRVALSVGPEGRASHYPLRPGDTSMSAVASTFRGSELKRDPKLQIKIDYPQVLQVTPQAFLIPKLVSQQRPEVDAYLSDPVGLSPDGKKLWAVVDTDRLGCWSVEDNQLLYSFSNAPQVFLSGKSRIHALAVGQSIVAIACAPRHIYIFDANTGECRHRWEVGDQKINSVQIFDNDQTALFGTENGVVGCLQVETGEITTHYSTASPVISVSVSGDERRMLYATADGTLATWEVTARDAWEIDFEMQVTSAALTDAVIGNRAVAYHVAGEIAPVVVDFVAVLESLEDLGF